MQFGTTTGGDVLNIVTSNGLCASLDVAGAPVQVSDGNGLLGFTATQNAQAVDLSWTVANTIISQRYNLARSVDGLSFLSIKNVEELKDGFPIADYSYQDDEPLDGWNYYRLSHFANDNTLISSLSAQVFIDPLDKASLSIFPNPSNGIVNLRRLDQLSIQTQIVVFTLSGQMVLSLSAPLAGGETATLDVSSLPAGFYQIAMVDPQGNRITTTKLVVN
ncbi:MAG: T9SS type A sorting domain-containing protein [Bacteroidota bacterium]